MGYEVAELASYLKDDDPRPSKLPWKVYPTEPLSDTEEHFRFQQDYNRAQFGALRFDQTVLDFRPDYVLSWRDFWHDEFIACSQYRHLFRYIWSTCIDSEPPQTAWLDRYSQVDLLSSYSQWGLNVLKKYGGEHALNVSDIDTMPGVDLDTFKPMDRHEIRNKYGLKDDAIIITMCARNQMRKLYPDLIRSFMALLDRLYKDNRKEWADRLYLYLHTSLQDVGWDIINEVKNHHASHRVLITYWCNQCKEVMPSFLQGNITHCRKCGRFAAHSTNTAFGASREQLAEIYNLADLYVQAQIAGACEIPILEARACGIPTLAADYAAPTELQSLPGSAGLVKLAYLRQEPANETGQFRGYMDNDDLVKKIYKFLRLSDEEKNELKKLQRKTAIQHHSVDGFVDKWLQLIEQVPPLDPDRWYQPPNIIKLTPNDIPWGLNDSQLVRWCCTSVLPHTHPFCSFLNEKELLRKVTTSHDVVNGQVINYTRQHAVNELLHAVDEFNHFEEHRHNLLVLEPHREETGQIPYRIFT
jgi:glycosyltransferase involved in cell wall biosynthesis